MLDIVVDDAAALADALDCDVAEGWEMFPAAMGRFRDAVVADPSRARWGPRLFVVDAPRTLVGWGGFKGPPDGDGTVEIGYAVAPSWQGRGIATVAVNELLREAWSAREVRRVLAHTLPEPNASVRVLEKSGFAREGEDLDGDVGHVWRFRTERPAAPAGVRSSRGAVGR